MNYRTRQGLKHLTISFILFLTSFWILTDYPKFINVWLGKSLDWIKNNILEDSVVLSWLNYVDYQWYEFGEIFPISILGYVIGINEFIFLILGIISFIIFIKSIIHFIYRIRIKNRIRNNKGIDHTDKFHDNKDHKRKNKLYNHKVHTYNVNFGQIEGSYESDGLEKVIEFDYDQEKIINTKIFFSKKSKDWKIFVRDYQEKIDHNIIHLKINPTKNRTNARLISSGNFDFNDSSDSGYSLLVSIRFFEKPLLDELSSILRDNKFACFSSNYTIHAHRDSNYPNFYEGKKILEDIADDISSKLIKFDKL